MFYDIFSELCKQACISPYKFSQATGIGQSTISMWKKKNATPQGDTLQKVANYFGVSTDYLLTGKEPQQNKTAPGPEGQEAVSETRQELNSLVSRLTEEGAKKVLDMIVLMYGEDLKDAPR